MELVSSMDFLMGLTSMTYDRYHHLPTFVGYDMKSFTIYLPEFLIDFFAV